VALGKALVRDDLKELVRPHSSTANRWVEHHEHFFGALESSATQALALVPVVMAAWQTLEPPTTTLQGEMEQPLSEKSSDSPTTPLKVLYIMGAARCGSTILDNILNEIDGFFSVGELRFLWERLHQGRLCGCGRAFEDCEVWSLILPEVLGSDLRALPAVLKRQKAISATWRTWPLLYASSRDNVTDDVQAYAALMSHLYQTIGRVTGARVVIDSSKRPWDAALLGVVNRSAPMEISPFFIHLVRDPRAMAYSQLNVKANPDREQPAVMKPTGVTKSALQWVRWNVTADAVRAKQREVPSMMIGYRDFCSDPVGISRAITEFVGEGDAGLPFSSDHAVSLEGNHTVSGNPDRFRKGMVTIREDNKWETQMKPRDKLIASALTLPLIRRYSLEAKKQAKNAQA
jgi:Sulfotransferase family